MRYGWLIAGSLSAFLAIAAGAFATHVLRPRLTPDMLEGFQTGARYQTYHALALLILALIPRSARFVDLAGWCFLIGSVLFSGSLYVLALGGPGWLGPVTPLGGVSLLGGWAALAIMGLRGGRGPAK